jgi:hypothetical protein
MSTSSCSILSKEIRRPVEIRPKEVLLEWMQEWISFLVLFEQAGVSPERVVVVASLDIRLTSPCLYTLFEDCTKNSKNSCHLRKYS